MRCEKLWQQPHKPRTERACSRYCDVPHFSVLGRTQDPRERSKPDQGCFRVPATGPEWRHCLPPSTWRINNTPRGTHSFGCNIRTTCWATINYSTSSSESQSIRHTSPHNCVRDTGASIVADLVLWTLPMPMPLPSSDWLVRLSKLLAD